MLISPIKNFNYYNLNFNKPKTSAPSAKNNSAPRVNYCYPKQYYISFTGRVDKGLKSFAQRNENYMPSTLKKYIQSLDEEELAKTTPLEAQCKAFEYLEICETPDDIKAIYPDEPLFQDLKSLKDSKGKRGLIFDINLMQDDINQTGEKVLASGEDLTVYLVKKIFLEGKTLNKINDDLHNDLNPVFKKEEKGYILSSTLRALGIKRPKTEYINSLKFTNEDYADTFADNMRKRWNKLSDEQKAAFRDSIIKGKQEKAKELTPEEIEARKLNAKKAQEKRWQNMSAEEKAAQIQSMMNGSKKYKVIMINAWNKVPELRDALSRTFMAYNISNPVDKIYKTNNHSKIMSDIMTEFWSKNEPLAKQMGEAISSSFEEYERAKENGTIDNFINSVYKKRSEITANFKKDKENELFTYAQTGALSFSEIFPYCPLRYAADVGEYGSKYYYSKANINYDEFLKEHPYSLAKINTARVKELLNCVSKDYLPTLTQFASNCDSYDINTMCKNLMDGNLEFEINSQCLRKPVKLKFSRKPDQKTIDEYYDQYEKTTIDTEKVVNLLKREIIKFDENNRHILDIGILRKIVKSFGPCAMEVLNDKSPMGEIIKNTIFSQYMTEELNVLIRRASAQDMTKSEFEKILNDARQ